MSYEGNSIFWIDVEKVVPNPFQPRREFDEAKLKDLSESIRMYGLLQPITVTRKEIISDDGSFSSQYELIAGERRLRASKLAELSQIPAIIRSGEETELMKLELAIIENLQREDLNAVDRALAFKQLAVQFELSHSQVAKKVGRSREYVSNSIRLLQLPETILSALRQSEINDGHARTLLMLNDRPEEQDVVFREILLKKLSVREVERIARKIATDKVRKYKSDVDPDLLEMERKFTETLGTRVQIQKTDFGGKLTIDYFSQDDLEKILTLVHEKPDENGQTPKNAYSNFTALTEATPLTSIKEPKMPDVPVEVATVAPLAAVAVTENVSAIPAAPSIPTALPEEVSIPQVTEVPLLAQEAVAPQPELDPVTPVVPNHFAYSPGVDDIASPEPVVDRGSEFDFLKSNRPAESAESAPSDSVSPTAVTETAPAEEEEDLYSIKNFSL